MIPYLAEVHVTEQNRNVPVARISKSLQLQVIINYKIIKQPQKFRHTYTTLWHVQQPLIVLEHILNTYEYFLTSIFIKQ